MQKITFEDLPSTQTPIDATNLNNMQNNIENDINKKINFIELLTVDSIAPSECEAGELYYNTLTELIYTATDTNAWNTVGTNPSQGCLYIDKENHAVYYYDGNNLSNYGAAVTDNLDDESINPPSVGAVNEALENLDTELNNKIDATNESINTFRPVVLWENTNPYSDFSSGNINLSSTDYDYIELYYLDWQYQGFWSSNTLCQKLYKGTSSVISCYFIYNNQAYMGVRRCAITNNNSAINFSACTTMIDGNRFAANENNAWCIPIKVLGYKYYEEVESNESQSNS